MQRMFQFFKATLGWRRALELQSSTLFLAFKRESTEAETFLYLPQLRGVVEKLETHKGWMGTMDNRWLI